MYVAYQRHASLLPCNKHFLLGDLASSAGGTDIFAIGVNFGLFCPEIGRSTSNAAKAEVRKVPPKVSQQGCFCHDGIESHRDQAYFSCWERFREILKSMSPAPVLGGSVCRQLIISSTDVSPTSFDQSGATENTPPTTTGARVDSGRGGFDPGRLCHHRGSRQYGHRPHRRRSLHRGSGGRGGGGGWRGGGTNRRSSRACRWCCCGQCVGLPGGCCRCRCRCRCSGYDPTGRFCWFSMFVCWGGVGCC